MKAIWLILWTGALFSQQLMFDAPTPAASPTAQGINAIVRTDFLYWLARQDGLEYDLLSVNDLSFNVMDSISPREVNFQWNPGFRTALGVRSAEDHWELKALWTHLWTRSSSGTNVADGQGLSNHGVWNDGVGIVESINSTKISSRWGLHYNTLDGGYSRSYFLGENLSSDLSFGAAGVWIKQTLDVKELNATPVSGSYSLSEQDLRPSFKSFYEAAGLFLRLSPEWHFLPAWSLVGSAAGYLVHGVFHIEQSWLVPELQQGDLQISKHLQRTRASLQAMLGLQWQTAPTNKNWHMAICLQYEGMIWFKQNLFSQVNTTFAQNYERRGDLEIQGGSLSMRFDF